jgi:simple sugar transport system substrate-binding protein
MLLIAVVLLAVVVAVAPAQTKWASNVRIVFFPGGPEGGPFAVNVYNGAKQAEFDLGCKVNYVWSDWDPQKMIQQFRLTALPSWVTREMLPLTRSSTTRGARESS